MVCALGPNLVSDRFAEFRRLARSKGTVQDELPQPPLEIAPAAPKEKVGKQGLLRHREVPRPEVGFMRAFFESVGEAQSILKQGRSCVQEMETLFEEFLQATMQEEQKGVLRKLEDLAVTARGHVAASKEALVAMQAQSDASGQAKPSPTQERIRANLLQAAAARHQQLIQDFQKIQRDIKCALEKRQFAELQLLCPSATEEQVQDMVLAGQTTSEVMLRRMAGAHGTIVEEVQRIREKHQDILRLEQSIADLAEMVREIAVLVDSQGELLDNIETNVKSANEYTEKGAKELGQALKIQHNTRKWQCFFSCFCMTLLVVIMAPAILR